MDNLKATTTVCAIYRQPYFLKNLFFLDICDSRVDFDILYIQGVLLTLIRIPFLWLYMVMCSYMNIGKLCPIHSTVFPSPISPPFSLLFNPVNLHSSVPHNPPQAYCGSVSTYQREHSAFGLFGIGLFHIA